MSEIIVALLVGFWLAITFVGMVLLNCNILGANDFIFETFKFKYFIEQIKSLYEDGGLYCPFSPDERTKYTVFGLIFLSILWLITFGIALIPAAIIAYIIWAGYWLFVKLCIKNVDN